MTEIATKNKIAELNDAFRKTLFGVTVVVTPGIQALSEIDQRHVLEKIRTFSTFTEDNDPHGEHDFGSITHNNVKIFWKIDYYDLQMEFLSPDPTDPAKTKRVLTVMLAEEY